MQKFMRTAAFSVLGFLMQATMAAAMASQAVNTLVKYAEAEKDETVAQEPKKFQEVLPDRSIACYVLVLLCVLLVIPVVSIIFAVICLPGLTYDYSTNKDDKSYGGDAEAPAAPANDNE